MICFFFFFQAEDGIRDYKVTGVQTCALPICPLADWQAGTPSQARAFDPDCDPQAPPNAEHYAAQVNAALRDNPPPAGHAARVARFAAVGLGAGLGAPDAQQQAALQRALDSVLPRLRAASTGRRLDSGWELPALVEGSFGDDFQARAEIAFKYIGMLESREAIYPLAWHDARGWPLDGSRRYRLRFAPGALPPEIGRASCRERV